MRFDLATLTRRQRNVRRARIVIRDIAPPATLATDLYRTCYAPIVAIWDDAVDSVAERFTATIAVNGSTPDTAAATDAGLYPLSGDRFDRDAIIPTRRVLYGDAEAGATHTDSNPDRARFTDSPAELLARLNEAQSEAERLYVVLDAALRDWALRVERWHRTRWRGAVLSATGVDLSTMLGAADVRQSVDATIAWNTSLIRDVSEQARKRMADAVFAGVGQRRPAREVAADLREVLAMSRRRSIGIASDQMTKLTSSLASERRRQAGIDTWRWRHSGKLHPREDHKARDGNEYTDADAPADLPGQKPYCGCREQAVLELN